MPFIVWLICNWSIFPESCLFLSESVMKTGVQSLQDHSGEHLTGYWQHHGASSLATDCKVSFPWQFRLVFLLLLCWYFLLFPNLLENFYNISVVIAMPLFYTFVGMPSEPAAFLPLRSLSVLVICWRLIYWCGGWALCSGIAVDILFEVLNPSSSLICFFTDCSFILVLYRSVITRVLSW